MTIWAISDGRRGIENQALGLAEAIARLTGADVASHHISSHDVFEALPPVLQSALKTTPAKFGLPMPLPKLAVGCGRQAIAPLIALRKSGVRTIYVQDPRVDPAQFDLVVAPEHDGLSGPNVISMLGSPNRITPDWLDTAREDFADDLAALHTPRAAILIGGDSKRHSLTEAVSEKHLSAARSLLEQGYSLMVTLSRRTPDSVVPDWSALQAEYGRAQVWLHDGRSATRNPYLGFLAGADVILVTEDSTNMLTEACATGAPVHRLPMDGEPGKFTALYDALAARCHVTRWDGTVTNTTYEPLDETARVAKIVRSQLGI